MSLRASRSSSSFGALLISVAPQDSTFYAGEDLVVEITFRNTARPSAPAPSRRPSSGASPLGQLGAHGHRSAQSLALPSPPASAPLPGRDERRSGGLGTGVLPMRRGLVGKGAELVLPMQRRLSGLYDGSGPPTPGSSALRTPQSAGLYAERRGPPKHAHSYSTAASTPDLLSDLGAQQAAMAMSLAQAQAHRLLNGAQRSVSGRKTPSIAEEPGQNENDDDFSTLYPRSRSPAHAPSDTGPQPTPRASVDLFRNGEDETMDADWRDRVTDYSRTASGAYGRPVPKRTLSGSSVTSAASTTLSYAPSASLRFGSDGHGTQTLLWTFAQLQGSFELDDTLIKPAEFIAVKRALVGGEGLTSGAGLVGGGTLHGGAGDAGAGWREWLLGNGQSPPPGLEGVTSPTEHLAVPTPSSSAGRRASGGGISTLEQRRTRVMADKTVPTFSTPPSILAVDLDLAPGEAKTYSYRLTLPGDLPPTYKGRAIRFSYTLLVGVNRAPIASLGETEQRSRLLRIPIRIYNNVSITGARPFYDLTNPVVWYRDEATTEPVDEAKVATDTTTTARSGRADFEAYASKLLESVFTSPAVERGKPVFESSEFAPTPSAEYAPRLADWIDGGPSARPEMTPRFTSQRSFTSLERIGRSSTTSTVEEPSMGEAGGCRAAVEFVSRNSAKASYEINKDGYAVATLTLAKTSFRLGETVQAVVVLNVGGARVLRLACRLETHELIETSVSTKSAGQVRALTRRAHAEHHEVTLDSARIALSLAIPSAATPDFATSGVKLQWSVRLSFLVMPPPPAPPAPALTGHTRAPSSASGLRPPPLSRPASHHGRSKSFGSFGGGSAQAAQLINPVPVSTGSHHLLPTTDDPDPSATYASYRAVPDLGFVPVLFKSAADALGAASVRSPTMNGPGSPAVGGGEGESVGSTALMRAKVETVECSIPIKIYPGNTSFRPALSQFVA